MQRLCCFFFLVVTTSLLACEGGFELCKKKVQDAKVFQNGTLVIPIDATKELVYTTKAPKQKTLKSDPFLSLYLVAKQSDFAYPFSVNGKRGLEKACVTDKKVQELTLSHKQIGLNSFAKLSKTQKKPALLLNSCCLLEGIITPQGLIEKEYLLHFLDQKKEGYSDIGIRIKSDPKKVYVQAIDPFLKNNPFCVGDQITHLNGKKVTSSAAFMRTILFADRGKEYTLRLKRDQQDLEVKVTTYRRHGGGYSVDTFLEQKGIYTDNKLFIKKLSAQAQNYKLELGDQILQVNGKKVTNHAELRDNLFGKDAHVVLLVQRENFQFFMHLQ